jgi:predicted aspartyl protease
MVARRVKKMGRIKVEVELANNGDLEAAERGDLPVDQVRRVTIVGVVDSGASRLVLPTAVANQLGLRITGKIKVTYADGRTAKRDRAEGVHLKLLGRQSVFRASLEPKRQTALIGALVLEDLDFLVDPSKERIYPRDPDIEVSEAE